MDSLAPSLSAPMAQMGIPTPDDPFLWDSETLSRELQNRPWVKHPAALAAKLAEEDVTGSTLLTYEILISRKELQESLGITTARSKAGLAEAILSFQARSRAFRAWKKNYLREKSIAQIDDEGTNFEDEVALAPLDRQYIDAAPDTSLHGIPNRNQLDQGDEVDIKPLRDVPPWDSFSFESDGDCLMQITNGDTDQSLKINSANVSPHLEPVHSPAPAQPSEERPSKRRRLAPTNLSATLLTHSDSFALSQHMSFNMVDAAKERSNDEEDPVIPPEYAYLGNKGRDFRTVVSHSGSLDTPWIDLGGGGFAVVSSGYIIPPGHRLATNAILRKQLMKNSKRETALKKGTALIRSPTPSNRSESVINLDDLPDSWDEETQREIDEENAETAARERERSSNLSKEHVESILREEVAAMEAKWKETKLPRYQLKAHKFWMDSKRKEETKEKMYAARRDAKHYDQRIKKLYAEILDDTWQTEREVRAQANVMEQSLSDKLYSTWFIALLEQRDPPPKPSDMPKPKPKLSRTKIPLGAFDDEVLTSSDEDDFIAPDNDNDNDNDVVMDDGEPSEDVPQLTPLQYTGEPTSPISDVEPSMVIDLTQLESPEMLKDSEATRSYIDLTSPIKLEIREAPGFIPEHSLSKFDWPEEVPPMDQLGSLNTIGEQSAKHWAKQKDRWRLILCLLWRLTQTRREGILRFVQGNAPGDAWQASIRFYQTNPLTKESDIGKEETKTVAFDVTKLFLSCIQCRQYTDVRVMALDKKDKNKINRAESFFPIFHAFIEEWAPEFPQSSQIFRTDAFDDEIGLDEADEHHLGTLDTPSKVRKHVAKEIVQNKEGVDLREREMKRAEELEARRVKLRAALANSSAISVDKSRLIINESKQDGQSFIYVNDEIGKLIKDHQVNGVRFLWNQIVLDAKVRQGCLLAHTMGLGKTMQVITFLVAVIEAANSEDESIQEQVPKDLRKSQSLILCPAGLVDNWLDEILIWSPKGLLGKVFKIEAAQKGENLRLSIIRDWERDGGVLVMGHEMFSKSENDMRKILTQTPSIVICDEAHVMKNHVKKLHRACQEFRTRSRIALTGSPLSNNVEEYYWMINWAAPNFLGPPEEFRDIYLKPIQDGLWKDSTGFAKRKALKMLEVLKMNVAPKVQRATTQCVRHELPAKYEFVIFVEPTPVQKMLYDLYLGEMAPRWANGADANVLGASEHLRLICNHPLCFRQKVKEMSQANAPGSSRASAMTQQNTNSGKEDDADDDCIDKAQAPAMTFPQSMISSVLKETNGADNANPALSRKVELLLMILDEARAIGDKVLVFSQSLITLNYLDNLFKQQRRVVCRLDGSTAVSKRQEQIKAFNTGKQEIYLISTQAGGVGLNIHGANRVVIFDFKWNPVREQQAVGRAYRFGQEKTVYVYQFVVSGSFEEALQNKTVFKMQLASRVVDKKNPVSWGKRVGDLMKPITAKPARDLRKFQGRGRDKILDKLIEYAQPSGVIREIISTDTFEEEDPTSVLTAEERRDAQELYDMEQLRHTNPAKYRMMLDQKQRADQIRALATARPASPIPDLYLPPSNPPRTGIPGITSKIAAAPDVNTEPVPQTQAAGMVPVGPQAQATPQFSSSAPLPIAGANTQILTPHALSILSKAPSNTTARELESRPKPGQKSGSTSTGAELATTPGTGASLFSQRRSQAKIDFENELAKLIAPQPEFGTIATNMARNITVRITTAQREQGHGFLPDDARWRLLLSHIQNHHRFMLAIIWSNCTPAYLATAPEEEIQNRIAIMNNQSEDDFLNQLRRTFQTPDPSNLNNIHRTVPQSARAADDAQVMRQAAEKRERFKPLPKWGRDEMSKRSGQS
ncbi:P-loop containing nucleoside triphosphate hydrolase protein [Trichoderma barbatum]